MIDTKLLDELSTVKLPEDISTEGIGSMNVVLSEIQDKTVRTTRLAVKVLSELTERRTCRNAIKAKLDVEKSRVMVENKSVAEAKNQGQRDAIVDVETAKMREEFEQADMEAREAEAAMLAVEHVLSCLKTAKELAGRQLDVVEKEINLGLITPVNR